MKTKPTPKQEAKLVETWNSTVKVGQVVRVTLDDGTTKDTFTTRPAEMLGGHSAVIWLNGFSGCYRLSRCTPIYEFQVLK